jgi:uracil permease
MARRIIGIHEKLPVLESLPLSFQHLTAMFGATILVPILLGVDPAIALLMNGIGTLIYTWVTKGGILRCLSSALTVVSTMLSPDLFSSDFFLSSSHSLSRNGGSNGLMSLCHRQ